MIDFSPSWALDIPALKEVSLLLSIAIFALATVGAVVTRRMNGGATPALRYGMAFAWIASLLRLYSASSYIWGEQASELGIFGYLRLGVLALLTIELILLGALVGYYYRRACPNGWRNLLRKR